MLSKDKILYALSQVQEPDLGKDLVSLEMIEDLTIDNKRVAFTLMLTTPACPMKAQMRQACENAIKLLVDKEAEVVINFGVKSRVQVSKGEIVPGVKHIIGVFSGKGGVGKSTVSSHLAIALAQKEAGLKVGLMDADIFGPSVPIMFGVQGQRPLMQLVDGKQKIVPIERHGIKLMSIGLLVEEKQALVWRGPMASNAVRQLITDVNWGELDYLILDMPPGTSDIHLTLLQLLGISGALIVSTPQKVALADAKKAIMMFSQAQSSTPILGILENMAYFTPPELPEKKYYIFGKGGAEEMATQFELPFLGEIPLLASICADADKGEPEVLQKSSLTYAAFQSLSDLVIRILEMYKNRVSPIEVRQRLIEV